MRLSVPRLAAHGYNRLVDTRSGEVVKFVNIAGGRRVVLPFSQFIWNVLKQLSLMRDCELQTTLIRMHAEARCGSR